jgi:hypothetical protein
MALALLLVPGIPSLYLVLWLTFPMARGMYIADYIFSSFLISHRQASMDYSLCGAISHFSGIKSVLFCYDVGCQYSRNLKKRLQTGAGHLKWPEGLAITTAVGKYHLGAHIGDCFAKFSLNFIRGAGQVDGKNLEPLWSSLNKIAPSTRAMGTSFHQESLDWHINESNWMKLSSIGMCSY